MDKSHVGLRDLFRDPPNEFRMMPFWFWNHEIIEKEVERQVRDHREHGIGGEFIHPRHGRLTPYMGRRWLELVEFTADVCKELEMPCYLYDEDNWPSGPAGGYITGPYRPENRGKFIAMFDEGIFEGPGNVEYELDYQLISPETEFFAAIAVPNPANYPDFSDVVDKWIDVSGNVDDNVFRWDVPEGEWTVVFFCVIVNPPDAGLNGYIDILRRETVKEFIDFTHKRYFEHFIQRGKGDYLGTVIPGIFTDEPSMSHMQVSSAMMLKTFAFTPSMPDRFKEMFGYDFKEILLSMVYDTGPVSAKYRCNYWECAIQMYVESFYKQIYDFCDKYHVATTGHVNAEGVFPSHIRNHGDFFRVFEYMHYGGCDQLTEDVRPDGIEHMWNLKSNPYSGMAHDMILTSKLASSAAHLLGKPRVLVEAFGTSSWDITMGSAKRVNDYLIATGCDLFVPHSFNISEDSYRKGDHPAAFNYEPYYEHWGLLCDHSARLCAILNASSGVLQAEALYLYPARSFHAEMEPWTSSMAEMLGIYFTHAADCLFRQQIDFELANEQMILNGEIVDNKIKIRNQYFKMLFLGATTCVSLDFARFVERFFNAGGKILACFAIPFKEPSTGESTEIQEIFSRVFGVSPKEVRPGAKTSGSADGFSLIKNNNANGGQAIFIRCPNIQPFLGEFYPNFEKACRSLLPFDDRSIYVLKGNEVAEHPAYIMALHKEIDNKHFFFLANTSRSESYENIKVSIDIIPSRIELWDTLTGEIKAFGHHGFQDNRTVLNLQFPCNQSYLFVLEPMA
ncbi:MAG: glycosyl hydrolase, partial [Promethearchaeota archaeon]